MSGRLVASEKFWTKLRPGGDGHGVGVVGWGSVAKVLSQRRPVGL